MYQYNRTISHHIAQLAQYREERYLPEFTHTQSAGRILSLRTYRSIIFFDLHEDGRFIQCAVRAQVAPEAFAYFSEHVARGNIVWVNGQWGQTNTGEVTLFCEDIELISTNLELISDLHDGFNEVAGRGRRELDLMLNPTSMQRFQLRSRMISHMRRRFEDAGFMEVETPILQNVASGAQANPFTTHFNATNSEAFLRIAPETYLVRLLAGGMSRIFEIGHTFRNEGVSPRHNPEFSMVEFYETYANLSQTMNFTQEMIQSCMSLAYSDLTQVNYQDLVLDFSSFATFTVEQSLIHFLAFSEQDARNPNFLLEYMEHHHITNTMPSEQIAWLQYLIFEECVENLLIQPTFITDLPIEASPLAYSQDTEHTHRFELFVAGREIANGFEQNLDYTQQIERFNFQARIAGRDNAMQADEQYLQSMRLGLPALSGCGIGIDRLVMLLCNTAHIRDVILYPF